MTANVPERAGPHRDDAQPGTPFLTQDDDYLHAPGLEVIHV